MARFLENAHGEDLCEELAIAKGSWLELLASILNRSCSAGGKDCQNQHVAKAILWLAPLGGPSHEQY